MVYGIHMYFLPLPSSPVHTADDVGEELMEEESSEMKPDEELVEEDNADSEEEGPMFLDLASLQQNKASEVRN